MASLRLGSKSEVFVREGQTWLCTSGLPSDITIEVGDMSFNLHKFPLLSRSGLLEKLIEDRNSMDNEELPLSSSCTFQLHDLPGGAKAFELVAKFCYGVRTELSASTVVALRCASEYLQMTEELEEGNLVTVTEAFLNEVFGSWSDSLKALETCEEVGSSAEDLHIVSRCIESLATKACSNPSLLILTSPQNQDLKDAKASKTTSSLWNGISSHNPNNPNPNPSSNRNPSSEEWWFEDVSFLSLPLFKQLILAIESKGMNPSTISSSIVHYAKKYLPMMMSISQTSSNNNDVSNPAGPTITESDQRTLLEELVLLLPNKKGATSSKILLRLLRIAMMLRASPSCLENLEKRVGAQLDQAHLVDLLIPTMGYSTETLYDIDCVQRILYYFMASDPSSTDDHHDQVVAVNNNNEAATSIAMVANLIDGYLAEVAVDVNLKLAKFEALASVIPDYVRAIDDGIYKAIDVYLKAHPWVTESEREEVCRVMKCEKLSVEASTHAAQNERLPLRVIVQVLFFEQLRLRTSISGWFFDSDNSDELRLRLSRIENDCSDLRKELQRIAAAKSKAKKSSWSLRFGFRRRPAITTTVAASEEALIIHDDRRLGSVDPSVARSVENRSTSDIGDH